MGTLSSELNAHVTRVAGEPRIYADANMPSGVVTFMRVRLHWDVLFVLEHLMARTLVTQDRDYIDDREFPPAEGAGVIVFTAPDERRLCKLVMKVDRTVFRAEGASPLPLEGRKVHLQLGD
jgi:hypothetical protein